MTRREMQDHLEEQLGRACHELALAYTAYLYASNRVECARRIGGRLRTVAAALDLAECYRRLTALEVGEDDPAVKARLAREVRA